MPDENIFSLPPVSEMVRAAGLAPKKNLGQNFLFDMNLTRKIARAVPNIENSTVVEVGPGPGGLTRALLECGAKKVVAIEKDLAAKPILDRISMVAGGRLEVIYGDAMKGGQLIIDDGQFAVCSNLPYNIGTELLIKWLHRTDIKSMTLMFQREVAERIVAQAGTMQYGRLSVLVALTARAKILFDIPGAAFVPPPKVRSTVMRLIPFARPDPDVEKLTALLFGQRRKMIRSLMPNFDWTLVGLTGAERAEQLPPHAFCDIISACHTKK
jgi:16S rRNA (adenine1518-N6/adenine1519-N6)-dimethyltransferase